MEYSSSFLAVAAILLLAFLLFKLVVFLAKLVFKPRYQSKGTDEENVYSPDFIEQDEYLQELEDLDTEQDKPHPPLD